MSASVERFSACGRAGRASGRRGVAEGAPGGDAGGEGDEVEQGGAFELGADQAPVALGQVGGAGVAVVAKRALPGVVALEGVGVDGRVGEDEGAPGPQDARDLGQRARQVGRVVQGGGGDDHVEAGILQRQRLQVAAHAVHTRIGERAQPGLLASRSSAVTRWEPASRRASHPLPAPRSSTRSARGNSFRYPRIKA